MKSQKFVPGLILLLWLIVPYLIAWFAQGDEFTFGGFLLNPLDGNSYLAKMHLGYTGEWKFQLPYTAVPGEGAYIFLYYIFVGHLARWFQIPLIMMFHISRVVNSALLFLFLESFLRKIGLINGWHHKGLLLLVFGSGMGWLFFFLGIITSDMWVAEAFPFLSMYVNPHFPLGMAMLVWLCMLIGRKWQLGVIIQSLLAGVILSIVMPFGLIIFCGILFGVTIWESLERHKTVIPPVVAGILIGLIIVGYQYFVSVTDAVLSGWNAQNETPTPPVWNLLVSFSPALILSVFGLYAIIRNMPGRQVEDKILVVWAVLGFLMLYLPFNLQRRFIFGYYIPVAILAVRVIQNKSQKFLYRLLFWRIIFVTSILSNVVIISMGIYSSINHTRPVYYTVSEYTAFDWMEQNTKSPAVVLCSPETGNILPGHTGRWVLYGHPFETVNAVAMKALVESYFRGDLTSDEIEDLFREYQVNYVFYGPSEQSYGNYLPADYLSEVVTIDEVVIYQVDLE